MKKLAFILYVGCVLAFSAFARAEVSMPFSKNSTPTASIQIESVVVDQANLNLLIDGFLPNPCTEFPSAVLVQDFEDPNLLILNLYSPVYTDICISRTNQFNTTVNLPLAAQNSHLDLDANTVYMIKVDGHDTSLELLGAFLAAH